MIAAARTLIAAGEHDRDLWLFDTFSGMTPPSAGDQRAWDGKNAAEMMNERGASVDGNIWCEAPLDEGSTNILSTGYPIERCHFVEGPVVETIPDDGLTEIAILWLDTDWYESTCHELRELYKRIVPRRVLIIDPYGEWDGARRPTDEFLASISPKPCMVRVDSAARVAVIPRTEGVNAVGCGVRSVGGRSLATDIVRLINTGTVAVPCVSHRGSACSILLTDALRAFYFPNGYAGDASFRSRWSEQGRRPRVLMGNLS